VARLVAARLVRLVAVLLAVSFLTFMAANLLPGDPIDALIPIELQEDREFVAELREEWGLNDPLLVRYGRWLGNAVQGDSAGPTSPADRSWTRSPPGCPLPAN